MKKLNLFLVILIVVTIFLVLTGCGGSPTTPPIEEDFINIIGVTPDSGLVDGVDTDFTVVVEYNLYSYTQGEVQVGFNNGESINVILDEVPWVSNYVLASDTEILTFQ